VRIEQARSSNVTTHNFAFGGALIREDLNAVLNGEGAETQLNGLYLTSGTRILIITQRSITPNRTARAASSTRACSMQVHGRLQRPVMVRKDAQKTDSKQSNKNLLLSEDAVINTKPQLEISPTT